MSTITVVSVTIPFTVEEFFAIFASYNEAVWPAQLVLYALALVITFLAIRPYRFSNQIIAWILGFMWLWMGLVYHIGFFSAVNSLAIVFGVLFVIQSGLLIWTGLWKRNLRFRATFNLRGVVGGLFILYAFVVYPTLGFTWGTVIHPLQLLDCPVRPRFLHLAYYSGLIQSLQFCCW